MAVVDDINRIFREFNRYSGDGLPNPPTNAPLPIGDPQSGVYHPKKSEIRGTFVNLVAGVNDATLAAEKAAEEAQEARDVAVSAAGTNLVNFASRSAAQETNIPPVISYLNTAGYAAPGDGGGALYKKVASEPSRPGKFQSADGAWWELAETTITPRMLGAAGDGALTDQGLGTGSGTDDTAALNAAISSLPPGGVLDGRGRVYKVLGSGNLLTLRSDIEIRDLILDASAADNAAKLFYAAGAISPAVASSEPMSAGEADMTVADASSFAADDWVWLDSPEFWDSWDDFCTKGELHRAKAVTGNVVTFYDPVLYDMGQAGLTLAKISPLRNITLRNVKAVGNWAGATGQQYGAEFRYVENLQVHNCDFSGFDDRAFWVWRCIAPVFMGNRIGACRRTGLSYGIQFAAGTYYAKVVGNEFYDSRHGVDFGDKYGVCRYALIDANTFSKMREAGISSHTASDHCVVSNNIIECDPNASGADGILWRSLNVQITGNRVVNAGRNGIHVLVNVTGAGAGADVTVSGNTISKHRGTNGILVRKQETGNLDSIIVDDNTVIGSNAASSSGIVVTTSSSTGNTFRNVSVCGNSIRDFVSSGVLINASSADSVVNGFVVIGNVFRSASAAQAVYVLATTDGNINNGTVMGNVISGTFTRGFRANNEENLVLVGNMFRGAGTAVTITATNYVDANNLV